MKTNKLLNISPYVRPLQAEKFFAMYPKMKTMMLSFTPKKDKLGFKKIGAAYCKFIDYKNSVNLVDFGATANEMKSEFFGEKTFYDFDFCGCGGWAELFQYVHNPNVKQLKDDYRWYKPLQVK